MGSGNSLVFSYEPRGMGFLPGVVLNDPMLDIHQRPGLFRRLLG
jgi:hypothetical protein